MTKASETRRRNSAQRAHDQEEAQQRRAAQLEALEAVRDDPQSTPGERLAAVRMIEHMTQGKTP